MAQKGEEVCFDIVIDRGPKDRGSVAFYWCMFARYVPTRNLLPSAATAWPPAVSSLRSLAPPPLASLANTRLHDRRGPLKKRLDLQVKPRPRMASEVGSEVTRSP